VRCSVAESPFKFQQQIVVVIKFAAHNAGNFAYVAFFLHVKTQLWVRSGTGG
jgi:hypothetical protein